MATHKFKPVRGKRFRITSLDNCGRVTESSMFTTGKGFVTVKLSAEVEDGAEILQRDFTGGLCINERTSDSFKYFTLEIEFCGVDPDALVLATNAKAYQDGAGETAGFTVPEGDLDKFFALEIWTGLSGQSCEPGAEDASGYILLPFVNAGVIGDIELNGEDAITFNLTGARTKGGNNWGKGAYKVVYDDLGAEAVLPTAIDKFDHMLIMDTGVPVPAIVDKATTVPALA